MNWAASEEFLLLMSLASEPSRIKAERFRVEHREDTKEVWLQGELRRAGLSASIAPSEWLEERWRAEVARQEREWTQRRDKMRRALQADGKLPPPRE
jgi:hypothetical protein